jgi:hypothetical protein
MIVGGIVILIVAMVVLAEKTEWMKEIWRGFLEMIGMTDDVMTSAAGTITANQDELLQQAAGEAAAKKLAEGIASGSEAFVGPAAAAMAGDVSDHVKTNSPAKKGPLHAYSPEQLGARIAQQFASGLTNNSGSVSSGLTSMLSSYENLLTNKVKPISYEDPYSANSTNGALGNNTASPNNSFSSPQGGEFKPLAKQSRGETKTIIVNATVNTGDFKMNVDSLSAAEASEFSKYVAKLMGGHIEKEMSRRNLG